MLPLVAAALWLVPAESQLYIQYCIYEPWAITKTRSLLENSLLCRLRDRPTSGRSWGRAPS
jgi:hypothetical protein